MAETSFSLDQFSCPVCLDLLKDPVTIPCGPVPALCICEIKFIYRRIHICIYCWQSHIWLSDVVSFLEEFPWDAAGMAPAMCKIILKETQRKFQQRIQQIKKDLEELREAVESHKVSLEKNGERAVEDSERIFIELICSIEKIRSKMMQTIREQEKAAVSRAEGLIEQLKQEIDDLKRRHTELEQISHTNDHIHFLKSFRSLAVSPESADEPNITVSSLLSFDDVRKSVSQLKEKLEDFCREEIEKISGRVTYVEIIPTNEPKIREEFLQYYSKFTLDPNTVNEHLRLSVWNGVFNVPNVVQQYPDHPDRFDHFPQVLCRESVCGRCYWELEWSGDDGVDISVSYKSVSRKGGRNECVFGCNDHSWSLDCSALLYSFWHNDSYTDLSVPYGRRRIGVIGIMSDKSELKAELERKKQRLAQIREEKKRKEEERKKKEAELKKEAVPPQDDSDLEKKRREADALLQSMGITPDAPV
ncbi:hypothetical protein cypCar_00043158, partial [Cyprinus carpio]